MGAVPSRENLDTIFSLRYGGHEIGLVPLVRHYFNDSNRELKRQFIRVWNDPSVRYHYPQTTNIPITKLPPPMYTEEDLEAFLDVVEKDLFDTNEEFLQASMEAAKYYAAKEREECDSASSSSLRPDNVAAFMSGPPRKGAPSSPSAKDTDGGVIELSDAAPHPGDESGHAKDKNLVVSDLNFPTFESLESLESSTSNVLLSQYASSGAMSGREPPQNLIPSSLLFESINESSNIPYEMFVEGRDKQHILHLPTEKAAGLPVAKAQGSQDTENVPGGQCSGGSTEATASSGVDGRNHLALQNVNISAPVSTSKLEEVVLHSDISASIAKARRCKRAIRPVPCAVLFVYVSGRKEADCFSFCGRKANVIGYFGCRTYKNERDDDVPFLQPCNIVLKAAGDRTVERVLILAARLYVEQYKEALARSMPDLNPILVFQQRYEAVRVLVSALWNNYPTLKFVYDTAALLWAINDISVNECLPSILWHENKKNKQQRLLIRLDGKVLSRMWIWMSSLACLHMHRGNWMQFVLNDFTQCKDKFVANWLDTNEAAAYFLRDRDFTKKVQQHLDQLHKEILRARKTPQSDRTQWSDQQERSYDGKLYRIFLSPYCGPFLTTVKCKEMEEQQKSGVFTAQDLDGWADVTGHADPLFDQGKGGQRVHRKSPQPGFNPTDVGGAYPRNTANHVQEDAATTGMTYIMDLSRQRRAEGTHPPPGHVVPMNCYIPSQSGNNIFMTTQQPINGGGVFSMPLLQGATPAMWDISIPASSEKTFPSLHGVAVPATSIEGSNASLPMIYHPGAGKFGAVGGGGANMNSQTLLLSTAKDAEGPNPSGRPSGAPPNNGNAMYFIPVSSALSMQGEDGSTRGALQRNLGVYGDVNAPTSEMQSVLMSQTYSFAGSSNNGNAVPPYTTSVPVMYTPGPLLYPSAQQQPPFFHPNYVMLSDGRIMTAFH